MPLSRQALPAFTEGTFVLMTFDQLHISNTVLLRLHLSLS